MASNGNAVFAQPTEFPPIVDFRRSAKHFPWKSAVHWYLPEFVPAPFACSKTEVPSAQVKPQLSSHAGDTKRVKRLLSIRLRWRPRRRRKRQPELARRILH